ncbi:MAG: hypothetical protein AB7E63_09325 [Parachlamydia sp.]
MNKTIREFFIENYINMPHGQYGKLSRYNSKVLSTTILDTTIKKKRLPQ